MKLKAAKKKESMLQGIKSIYSKDNNIFECVISIDIGGFIVIENFKKIIDYTEKKIILEARNKIIYIYGDDLKISSYNKQTANVSGRINKVELFDKEK